MDSFRKWLAFGAGVSVEVRDQELHVTMVRVRRAQTSVQGTATVSDYRSRPAAEWGAELAAFLKQLGASHIAATVLLPRRDVIVRTIQLPGVSDRDLESAIRLQIDSLHPFAEDDVYFSWARIGKTPTILVGIARREVIDQFSSLFAEAGIKVAAFTFSAAAIYSAIRLQGVPPSEGFFVAHESGSDFEIYGESPSRHVFSASFSSARTRAQTLARSELRLEPEVEPLSLPALLPQPAVFPASYDPAGPEFSANALAYATALAGACPWLSIDGNLLPLDRRRASSRVRLIPTFAMSAILLLLMGSLAAQTRWADGRYLGVLQHEIRRFEPQARRVDTLDKTVTETRARTQLLDDYRRRARHDMDALAEITKLIPPPGWVGSLEMDRGAIQIAGEADQAAGLLKSLDNSPLFEGSQFTMPITRTPSGDAFRIRVLRSIGGLPQQAGSQAGQSANSGYTPGFIPGAMPSGIQQAPVTPPPPPILPLPVEGTVR